MKHYVFMVGVATEDAESNAEAKLNDLLDEDEYEFLVFPVPSRIQVTAKMGHHLWRARETYEKSGTVIIEQREVPDPKHPFLLVEASTRDARKAFTFHASPEAAADYSLNQEYAGDWEILELVDLRTGDTLQPGKRTIMWEPSVG